ncbi:hypothetical protein [Roseomonas chloroacetimidivorans]|uniref:hypothetical protein n=1 Tax=Roseomonas chloroacetimidivorans TaxID=1766656 RepID=UPI003C75471B
MAKVTTIFPEGGKVPFGLLPIVIAFETAQGKDFVALPPSRVRELGIMVAYEREQLIPIPTP